MVLRFSGLTLLFFCCFFQLLAQDIAIGQWRDHLAYNRATSVAIAGEKVYCAADGNLFLFDKRDGTTQRQTKVEGLSDVGAKKVAYSKAEKTLVVVYSNTNIDLITDNEIYNLPDIKNKNFAGDKTINNVFVLDQFAYLACGFGIVKLDLRKREIKETWYVGNNGDLAINDVTYDGTHYYALTKVGVFKGNGSSAFLSDNTQWKRDTLLPATNHNSCTFFSNKVFVNEVVGSDNGMIRWFDAANNLWVKLDSTIDYGCFSLRSNEEYLLISFGGSVNLYNSSLQFMGFKGGYGNGSAPREAAMEGEELWIADNNNSLVRGKINSSNYFITKPSGPSTNKVYDLSTAGGRIYIAPGDQDQWGKQYNNDGISIFENNEWKVVDGYYIQSQANNASDVLVVTPDPKDTGRFFAAAWGSSIIAFRNRAIESIINNRNSSLDTIPGYSFVGVAGLAFDPAGNLWCTNSLVPNGIVVFNNQTKSWDRFFTQNLTGNFRISKIIVNQLNQKWMIMPDGGGLLAFDENGTIGNKSDDKLKKLGFGEGNGGLPGNDVTSIAEDKNGEIWVGTNEGIAVFYTPGSVFDDSNWEAQKILIEQGGYVENLLENEVVTAIAVDGANRKWIGTATSGVYLMSPDGTRELIHFTEANSPLFSDYIRAIAINGESGEVFFATSKGLLSYKYTATEPDTAFTDVYAYPNPVKGDFDGVIAIKGLVRDCDVKISDVSGNLVYTTKALGGQAVWNGQNFSGSKVRSGVYMVYLTNPDGSQRLATKILITR
jgi:hypothetical protein